MDFERNMTNKCRSYAYACIFTHNFVLIFCGLYQVVALRQVRNSHTLSKYPISHRGNTDFSNTQQPPQNSRRQKCNVQQVPYVVGSKSFRPDQLFKVTEIKQLCYFSTQSPFTSTHFSHLTDGTIYPSQHFPFGATFVCQAGNFWNLLRTLNPQI